MFRFFWRDKQLRKKIDESTKALHLLKKGMANALKEDKEHLRQLAESNPVLNRLLSDKHFIIDILGDPRSNYFSMALEVLGAQMAPTDVCTILPALHRSALADHDDQAIRAHCILLLASKMADHYYQHAETTKAIGQWLAQIVLREEEIMEIRRAAYEALMILATSTPLFDYDTCTIPWPVWSDNPDFSGQVDWEFVRKWEKVE